MAFQTQNSIKNEHCLERRRTQPWETTPQEKLEQEHSRKTAAYALQSVGKQNQNPTAKRGGFLLFWGGGGIQKAPSLHIDLYGPVRARCRFHPSADGRANSQQSPLHASPPLIVNSVNEVNLINFRAGSHMTFSSIFSPTSKTSISSSKMGRSEWQSPITPTYLKPRVNLFSSFECVHYNCIFKEDLQIAKKLNLSPRNVQKLFFSSLPLSFFFFFLIPCLSLSLSGWHKALWCCIFFFSLEQITTPTEVETQYCNLKCNP